MKHAPKTSGLGITGNKKPALRPVLRGFRAFLGRLEDGRDSNQSLKALQFLAFGLMWFFVYSQIYSQNEKYPPFRLLFDQFQAHQDDALLALVIVVTPSARGGVRWGGG
ncbi:hypothetical protein [Azotobacter chroococcum]|uniref:hypothetical protein n=1 Tax=Azotobacter chroococcum TaxID=353 RepID=UPI0012FE435A|nr:hypothetical protein [Azotobacter chroococcum]